MANELRPTTFVRPTRVFSQKISNCKSAWDEIVKKASDNTSSLWITAIKQGLIFFKNFNPLETAWHAKISVCSPTLYDFLLSQNLRFCFQTLFHAFYISETASADGARMNLRRTAGTCARWFFHFWRLVCFFWYGYLCFIVFCWAIE